MDETYTALHGDCAQKHFCGTDFEIEVLTLFLKINTLNFLKN